LSANWRLASSLSEYTLIVIVRLSPFLTPVATAKSVRL